MLPDMRGAAAAGASRPGAHAASPRSRARATARSGCPTPWRASIRAPGYEWAWQFVFPSKNRSADPESGVIRRHHVFPDTLSRAIKRAARAARHRQARELPHAAAFVRHAPAGGRLRHPHGAGAARALGRVHDDDLHARAEQGRARREKPARFRRRGRSAAGRAGCHGDIPDFRKSPPLIPRVERRSFRPFQRAELNQRAASGFNSAWRLFSGSTAAGERVTFSPITHHSSPITA